MICVFKVVKQVFTVVISFNLLEYIKDYTIIESGKIINKIEEGI